MAYATFWRRAAILGGIIYLFGLARRERLRDVYGRVGKLKRIDVGIMNALCMYDNCDVSQ